MMAPKGGRQLDRSAMHLLHRAGQCATDIFLAEAHVSGLTPRQFAVLATIAEEEGLTQTELVERTGIDRSTLADIVARLLGRGLIQRRRAKEDARAYAIKLTAQGAKSLARRGARCRFRRHPPARAAAAGQAARFPRISQYDRRRGAQIAPSRWACRAAAAPAAKSCRGWRPRSAGRHGGARSCRRP